MNTTLTKTLFGKEADFFIDNIKKGNNIILKCTSQLDRERSAIEITFEVEN